MSASGVDVRLWLLVALLRFVIQDGDSRLAWCLFGQRDPRFSKQHSMAFVFHHSRFMMDSLKHASFDHDMRLTFGLFFVHLRNAVHLCDETGPVLVPTGFQ